jgi:Carboxypeptidase regulatory-like domain
MNLATSSRRKIPGHHSLVRLATLSALLYLGNTPHAMHFAIAQSPNPPADAPSVQSSSASPSAGVITGKVTINGKGASDIAVVLRADHAISNEPPIRTVTTDQNGNYQITNVPAGAYQVTPVAPTFVISSSVVLQRTKTLILAERETVQNVDFALTRGGAITGKVTDTEGRPLIEQPITLTPAGEVVKGTSAYVARSRISSTDDRGIYRIFGLPKGKYLVSAGGRQGGFYAGDPKGPQDGQTFHPSVTDAAKATVIELSEGGEASNIDITVNPGPRADTFSISGRIIDGATGQPLPHLNLGMEMNGSSIISSGWVSNQSGEFRFQNLNPGRYSIFLDQQGKGEFRIEKVPVEIINQDVTGLVIKTLRSASIAGVIEFELGDAKSNAAMFRQLEVHTFVKTENKDGGTGRAANVNPDGSFRVNGLEPGTAFVLLRSNSGTVRILRFEREGMVQPRSFEIKDGETVSGIRMLVRIGTGVVRGIVRAEGGELPPPPRLQVWLVIPGEESIPLLSEPQVDSRGHFMIKNLPAGDYEVNASVFTSRGQVLTKQLINVIDGSVSDLTLTLNLKSDTAPD